MLDAKTLPEKFQQVKRQIQQTCQSLKRDPSTVRLMAVSKGQSIEKIRDIFNQGQRDFGENYAQELFHKAEALKDLNIQWHYIGKLQSNKIKKIVNIASSIHTVATLKHAEIIRTHLKIQGISNYPLFISVNILIIFHGLQGGKNLLGQVFADAAHQTVLLENFPGFLQVDQDQDLDKS